MQLFQKRLSFFLVLAVSFLSLGGSRRQDSRADFSVTQFPIKQVLSTGPDDVRWVKYVLSDTASRPMNVVFEYSLDGRVFVAATEKAVPKSEGKGLLTSTPGGTAHFFAWDLFSDLGTTPRENVTVRVTPSLAAEPSVRGNQSTVIGYRFVDRKTRLAAVDKYLLYYGKLTPQSIASIVDRKFQMMIIDFSAPLSLSLHSAENLEKIKKGKDPNDASDDIIVIGYAPVTEDSRTVDLSPADVALIPSHTSSSRPYYKFRGDGAGPSKDPRGSLPGGDQDTIATLAEGTYTGVQIQQGFKSYYLYDNYENLKVGIKNQPSRNVTWGGFHVNAGDPEWFKDFKKTTMAEHDPENRVRGVAGFDELLTYFRGSGYHLDGLFLDVLDGMAPNSWTDASSSDASQFEWISKGTAQNYLGQNGLRGTYPEALLIANRGFFLLAADLHGHFALGLSKYFDGMVFESFMTDNADDHHYVESYWHANRWEEAPRLMAEAQRHQIKLFSVGYVNGPSSQVDPKILEVDFASAKKLKGWQTFETEFSDVHHFGFTHYVGNGELDTPNDVAFWLLQEHLTKPKAPEFRTTAYYYQPQDKPPTTNRAGVQYIERRHHEADLYWDVAVAAAGPVKYNLYYDTRPIDFGNLTSTKFIITGASLAQHGYASGTSGSTRQGWMAYPFKYTVANLDPTQTYYFAVKAVDTLGSMDENRIQLEIAPGPGDSFRAKQNFSTTAPVGAVGFESVQTEHDAASFKIKIQTVNPLATDAQLKIYFSAADREYRTVGTQLYRFEDSWIKVANVAFSQADAKKSTSLIVARKDLGDPTDLKFFLSHANLDPYGLETSKFDDLAPVSGWIPYTF